MRYDIEYKIVQWKIQILDWLMPPHACYLMLLTPRCLTQALLLQSPVYDLETQNCSMINKRCLVLNISSSSFLMPDVEKALQLFTTSKHKIVH